MLPAAFLRRAQVRGLSVDTAYWVCAYANRQHALALDIAENPRESSFFRAMLDSGGVLLVLDPKRKKSGPATPFQRIWCDFEDSLPRDRCRSEAGATADDRPSMVDAERRDLWWVMGLSSSVCGAHCTPRRPRPAHTRDLPTLAWFISSTRYSQ